MAHFKLWSHVRHGVTGELVESIAARVQGRKCVKEPEPDGNEAQQKTSFLGTEPGIGLGRKHDV